MKFFRRGSSDDSSTKSPATASPSTSYFPSFLRQSLEDPILDQVKKQTDQAKSSIEDIMELLAKQLEASEKHKSDYLKRYEDAINDKNKLAQDYMSRVTNLQKISDERCSTLSKTIESTKHESMEWKRKYENSLSKQKSTENQAASEVANLKARSSVAEARLAAAREQTMAAQEEAEEWKRKYDIAVREAKSALEKAAAVQNRSNKQIQQREDVLRAKFASTLADKEAELKDRASRLDHADQCVTTLSLQLKLADTAWAEAITAQKEKNEIQKLAGERLTEIVRSERHIENLERQTKDLADEVERFRSAELDAVSKVAMLEARVGEREKEIEKLLESNNEQRASTVQVLEALLETERAARAEANNRAEALSYQLEATEAKLDILQQELSRLRQQQKNTSVSAKSGNTVQVLETLLETERAARAEVNYRAEALSVQLQATQGKLDLFRQQMSVVPLNEPALDGKLKPALHGKHLTVKETVNSVREMDDDDDEVKRVNKRSRSIHSPLSFVSMEDGRSVIGDEENNNNREDHTKFTVLKLKQELTKNNFGAELLQLKNPTKKELVALYEKRILNPTSSWFKWHF